MSEENKQPQLQSDEAALDFLSALCLEMLDVGELHTQLMPVDGKEETEELKVLMKANAMMVFSSLLLMSVVQDKMYDVAHLGFKLWTSQLMQDINLIAFKEEISKVRNDVDLSIVDIENFINKENNESSSESSDGSSDI